MFLKENIKQEKREYSRECPQGQEEGSGAVTWLYCSLLSSQQGMAMQAPRGVSPRGAPFLPLCCAEPPGAAQMEEHLFRESILRGL